MTSLSASSFVSLMIALVVQPAPSSVLHADVGVMPVEWETTVGVAPTEGRARIHRLAVCADGTSHLTIQEIGRLATLSPAGEVLRDQTFSALEGAVATACDSDGALVAATMDGQIVTIRQADSGPPTVTERSTGTIIRSFALSKNQPDLVALAVMPSVALFRLSRAGVHVSSFGSRELQGDSREMSIDDGWVFLDESSGRLTIIPRNRLELLDFEPGGRLAARRVVQEQPFAGRRYDEAAKRMLKGDTVLGAAKFSDGRTAVQVGGPSTRATGPRVLILSRDSHTLLTSASAPHGHLSGADASGALYFVKVGRGGPIRVVKARLSGADPKSD